MAKREALVIAASLLLGCSSDRRLPGAGGGFQPPPPTNQSTLCTEPPGPDEICIETVKGSVVDASGNAITVPINLCNAELCFSTKSDDGLFNVEVNSSLDLSRFLIHAFGYPDYSDTFVRLARPTSPNVTLAPLLVTRLDQMGTLVPDTAAAATTVTAGPVAITLSQGTSVSFYPAHDVRLLRAGAVADPKRFDKNMLAVYALGPFGARLSAPAEIAITLPATPAVADGTILEVLELEDDLYKPNVGQLATAGNAVVTGGVARGGGIRMLTWIALRTPATP